MLSRLRGTLLVTGALLMTACGFGLTIYNLRWYSSGEIQSWGRQWSGLHGRMLDSGAAAGCFGLFCCIASVTAIVFFMIDFNKMITQIVFLGAVGLFIIEMIPELIILCGCHTFSADNELFVHYDDRNYYNESSEYRNWVDKFWREQLKYPSASMTVTGQFESALRMVGGWFLKLPSSNYWNQADGRYDVVTIYDEEGDKLYNAYSCIVDFTPGKTVYDYYSGKDSSVCDTMSVTAVECIGRWNEKALLNELKRQCDIYWVFRDSQGTASSAEEYSKAVDATMKRSTDGMTHLSLPAFYMINSIFFGIQVVAVLFIGGGVALSFLLPE